MKPFWACEQWGQYEHDWRDCTDCIRGYEKCMVLDDTNYSPSPIPEPIYFDGAQS